MTMWRMYVYFIQGMFDGISCVKIGKSNTPEDRLKALQTANPVELKLVTVIPCKSVIHATNAETFAHQFFNGQRRRGEWFVLPDGWELSLGEIIVEAERILPTQEQPLPSFGDPEPPSTRYGQLRAILRSARKEAGLTQRELSARLKRDKNFVQLVESGERALDVIEYLQYAKALKADPLELLKRVMS